MAVLKVENLTKVFPAARKDGEATRALDRIDLEIGDHTFVSLVGPSGCGKSTFLNILSGVEEPSSGRISVTGEEGGDDARFGYVFQDPRLLPWRTIMQNMLYVHDDRGRGRHAAAHSSTSSSSASSARWTCTQRNSPEGCSSAWESPAHSRSIPTCS